MLIKPNNLLFLCYLWWLICLIKFTKHQSCLLHLLSYYEAFKWSFSHSSIFQTTQDICPQTSKKNRFLLSLSFWFFGFPVTDKKREIFAFKLQKNSSKFFLIFFLSMLLSHNLSRLSLTIAASFISDKRETLTLNICNVSHKDKKVSLLKAW